MSKNHLVVLTGFGVFGKFKSNPSWEVVKAVNDLGTDDLNIQLMIKEIKVCYETVTEEVPKLWEELKPCFVVHVGVAESAKNIVIESCAHQSGYVRSDVEGKLPPKAQSFECHCEVIFTKIDLEKIVEDLDTKIGVAATISKDAGRYLCEFIFYTSLRINDGRSLFIHVPDVGKPYTIEQMAKAVKFILGSIMNQIDHSCCCQNNAEENKDVSNELNIGMSDQTPVPAIQTEINNLAHRKGL